MKEERTSLVKKKEDLELQTNEMNLPFSEARDRLQNRIKQDNIELKTLDKEYIETKRMVDTYNTNIKEIENDLRGGGQSQG